MLCVSLREKPAVAAASGKACAETSLALCKINFPLKAPLLFPGSPCSPGQRALQRPGLERPGGREGDGAGGLHGSRRALCSRSSPSSSRKPGLWLHLRFGEGMLINEAEFSPSKTVNFKNSQISCVGRLIGWINLAAACLCLSERGNATGRYLQVSCDTRREVRVGSCARRGSSRRSAWRAGSRRGANSCRQRPLRQPTRGARGQGRAAMSQPCAQQFGTRRP